MKPRCRGQTVRTLALWCATAAGFCLPVWARRTLDVRAGVDSEDVFLGESFVYQIVVSGDEQPDAPDIDALKTDFQVQALEPRTSQNTQIRLIDGNVTRVVNTQTVLMYRLTPKRLGTVTIPELTVTAGNKTGGTDPITLQVREPMSVNDDALSLTMTLSKETVTVGEPVTLTWTWLVATDVQGFQFSLPLFDSADFRFPDVPVDVDPRIRDRYLAIRLPDGRELVGMQQRVRHQGKQAIQVTFEQVLIPRRPGTMVLPESTVVCEVLAGYRNRSRRGLLDDFWGQGRNKVYRKAAVHSNSPTLTVQPLPAEGQPEGFAGHVGTYRIRATAKPTEVRVGEPITLTITLSGPEFLEDVRLPPIERQEDLARDFRVSGPEPGIVENGVKVFKRILRAKHPDVERIPALTLVYFDTATGRYETAATDPLPVTVQAARVVTAMDAEGQGALTARSGRRLKTWMRGIAANYEDMSVLQDQRAGLDAVLRTPALMVLLAGTPLAYVALLGATLTVRRRRADPAAAAARKALSRALKRLHRQRAADAGDQRTVLKTLREYLGAKLGMPAGAIVYEDVQQPLQKAGVAEAQLEELQELFLTCEAGQYAGAVLDEADRQTLITKAGDLLKRMDRTLR